MTLVCPYYINTGMFSGVKVKRVQIELMMSFNGLLIPQPRLFPMLEPKYVADQLVKATLRNEVNCTLPASIKFTAVPFK